MTSRAAAADPSYSSVDHERPPDPAASTGDDDSCCARFSPIEDPEEFANLLSIIAVSLGMLLLAVGYIYPRDYEFDPHEEARVMESIELYYHKLGFALDVLILMGMGLVGLGGLVYSVLFMRMMFAEEGVCFGNGDCCSERREDGVGIPLTVRKDANGPSGYGATTSSH